MDSLWKTIPGTLDMQCEKHGLIAIYKESFAGRANYWTFPAVLSPGQRRPAFRLSVGGLPDEALCRKLVANSQLLASRSRP